MGHALFGGELPKHETLVHPGMFATQLLRERNHRQKPGFVDAELARVLVFRGEPSPDHDPRDYARNQAQRATWQRDARVLVTLRPLKYDYQRAADGRPATTSDGRRIVTGKREKGVDVLCALAAVREAAKPDIDLVILASSDSDLAPVIDEVQLLGAAKIETTSWYDADLRVDRALRGAVRRVWNTRLNHQHFELVRDLNNY